MWHTCTSKVYCMYMCTHTIHTGRQTYTNWCTRTRACMDTGTTHERTPLKNCHLGPIEEGLSSLVLIGDKIIVTLSGEWGSKVHV